MRGSSAMWLAVLAVSPACSLLFDARDLAGELGEGFDDAGPIVRFEATPESIALGDTARLVWETSGAGEVSIEENGEAISAEPHGAIIVEPKSTSTYRITANGESLETTIFVDREVPPEIIRFSLSPDLLFASGPSTVDARWRVSHGTVALTSGPELQEDLPQVGSFEARMEASTDVALFAFAAGSAERTLRAWSIEEAGSLSPESPHPIGEDAVMLEAIDQPQHLTWSLPERRTLLPEVVDADGDCVDAEIVLTRSPEMVADVLSSCGGESRTIEAGDLTVEVTLYELPTTPILLPAWRNPACGNGIVELLEQCDDYDLFSGDGCSASCELEAGVDRTPERVESAGLDRAPDDARELELSPYQDGGELGWAMVAAPFAIPFYGRSYAGVIVHRSGAITFDLDTLEEAPRIPDDLPSRSIGHDLVVALGSSDDEIDGYDAKTWSTPDELVVDLTSRDAHLQVHFFATGEIELRFGELDDDYLSVTSGFQERTGHLGGNAFACDGRCQLDEVPEDASIRLR